MSGKKLKAFAAIVIGCSLFTSQIAMADSAVKAETTSVEKSVAPTENKVTTKISLEEAKKIVKSFSFTKGYEISNINLENGNGPARPIWRIDLYGGEINTNMMVSITADTGELVNFNNWENTYKTRNIVAVTKKQAQATAEKFIKENVSIKGRTLEIIPDSAIPYEKSNALYEVPQYTFNFSVKLNGVLAVDTMYSVSVNAVSGIVNSYYSPYSYSGEPKYPSATGVKDLEFLKKKYTDNLKMQLQYITSYSGNEVKALLVYFPVIPGMIDAKTGEVVKDAINYNPMDYYKNLNKDKVTSDTKVVIKEITEAQAEKKALDIKAYFEKYSGVKFSDNNSKSYQVDPAQNQKIRYYNYNSTINKTNYYLSISINLSTGNIINLSFYYYSENEVNGTTAKKIKEKVDYAKAKKNGDEILKNVLGQQFNYFVDMNIADNSVNGQKDQPTHQFSYMRFANGIPTNETMGFNVDKETGRLLNVYMNWNDISYPAPVNVISEKKAKDEYIDDAKFGLAFYTPYIYKDGALVTAKESIIVYRPLSTIFGYIDAEKGTFLDYAGNPYPARYSNQEHWAALNIEMLETQGIVLNNITNYDEKLTRQDAVRMVSLIGGVYYINSNDKTKSSFPDVPGDNEYFRYVEGAVASGIIKATGKNFEGKQNITKQEFVDMLLNALGYEGLLKHPELFSKSESDLKDAICRALDILPVKPGETYNSTDNITFAEAAYSIQKGLKSFR